MPLFGETRQVDETLLSCPREGREMRKLEVEGVTIDRCDSCGGTWFDAKELRRVAQDREVEKRAAQKTTTIPTVTFDCPRCEGACVEGWVEEVRVDTCTRCHGVWLDRGELDEAKRHVRANRILSDRGDGFRAFLLRV